MYVCLSVYMYVCVGCYTFFSSLSFVNGFAEISFSIRHTVYLSTESVYVLLYVLLSCMYFYPVCTSIFMYFYMYVCMYVCMNVCMYSVCTYTHVSMYLSMYLGFICISISYVFVRLSVTLTNTLHYIQYIIHRQLDTYTYLL